MNSRIIIAMVLSSVRTKSERSYLLTLKTETGDNIVVFAPKSIATTETNDVPSEQPDTIDAKADDKAKAGNKAVVTQKNVTDAVLINVAERFTTGSCFTFSVVDNKEGDLIYDRNQMVLLDDNKNQRTFKSDSTFVLGASAMPRKDFVELVTLFK